MDKITEMLIRERDLVEHAIKLGKFIDIYDKTVKTTPENAALTLKNLNYLISEAEKINS